MKKDALSVRARKIAALFTIVGMFVLASCTGLAYSPEAAAQQEVIHFDSGGQFKADPTTIQVLQTAPLGESRFVLISFQGNRMNSGREHCLFMHEIRKNMIGGWTAGGGGGGCSNEQPDPSQRPISIGGNQSSGSGKGDPGYSAVNGEVFRNDIPVVQVTWNDGLVQTVEVVNNSYLALRSGQFMYDKVDALNQTKEVVYSFSPNIPPEKR